MWGYSLPVCKGLTDVGSGDVSKHISVRKVEEGTIESPSLTCPGRKVDIAEKARERCASR